MSRYVPPRYRYVNTLDGVVAANNFLTLVNPAASGKVYEILVVRVHCASVGAVSGQPPMILSRASSVSGGSLVTNSTGVAQFDAVSNPVASAQLRTGNPTATAGQPVAHFQSIESTGTGASAGYLIDPGIDGFLLHEGEGLLWRTASGSVDQRWLIAIAWEERGS